ncbi:MAG: DNA polymerase III subunit gamma/tau [Muribaculaceae bacterium]|nr:DNA polymerase III subunit gamma/tau [Muribaculaceae bacterium]
MDNYIVSARKYRPSTFASVVGQKALTSTLKNAIATGKLAHAYLFCGSRGVGKTSCARIFAKTINCEHPTPDGDPCNECDSCRAFNAGSSLNIVELDAASNNGVDDIRSLVEQVQVPPTNGRYRVFIIDEVHMLTSGAFNAFLKTLEEPPSYVVFILATTEKHKIIPTILSRCQIYDFSRITISDMVDHLAYVAKNEGIEAERSALSVIASKADGAMRDALSIFDQVAASSRGNITYKSTIDNLNVLDSAYYSRLVDAFLREDVTSSLLIYKEIRDHGFDSHFFINGLGGYIRDLMVASQTATQSLLDTDDATREQLAALAARCTPEFLYKAMSLCNDADLKYRQASNKTFLVELLLIKLCQLISPSPIFSGDGEGLLKPLGNVPATPATPTAAPAAASAPVPPVRPDIPRPTPAKPEPQRLHVVSHTPPPPPPSGAPATQRRQVVGVPHTISINPAARHAEAKASASVSSEASAAAGPRSDAYTLDRLNRAWGEYMAQRPTERILVNTMRACPPQPVEGKPDLFVITVENPAQRDLMTDQLPSLLKHIHDSLGNDLIAFEIAINEGVSSPATWNEREVIAYMQESSPAVAEFFKKFKLTLG